jgi:hypothetical protein
MVTLGPDPGPIVGRVSSTGEIFADDAGVQQLGKVDGEGVITGTEREILGKVDAWGHVHDRMGTLVGTVEHPADGGVLMLIAQPASSQSAPAAPVEERSALMDEALELGQAQRFPKVRTDYKPLTDRDLFMEGLRKGSGD